MCGRGSAPQVLAGLRNAVLHSRGLPEGQIPRRVSVPDFAGRLPEPIRKFTGAIHDATHLSFVQGGGHGGSHPHLVHNFLLAVLGKQPAFPDAPDERELHPRRPLRPRVGNGRRHAGRNPAVLTGRGNSC